MDIIDYEEPISKGYQFNWKRWLLLVAAIIACTQLIFADYFDWIPHTLFIAYMLWLIRDVIKQQSTINFIVKTKTGYVILYTFWILFLLFIIVIFHDIPQEYRGKIQTPKDTFYVFSYKGDKCGCSELRKRIPFTPILTKFEYWELVLGVDSVYHEQYKAFEYKTTYFALIDTTAYQIDYNSYAFGDTRKDSDISCGHAAFISIFF